MIKGIIVSTFRRKSPQYQILHSTTSGSTLPNFFYHPTTISKNSKLTPNGIPPKKRTSRITISECVIGISHKEKSQLPLAKWINNPGNPCAQGTSKRDSLKILIQILSRWLDHNLSDNQQFLSSNMRSFPQEEEAYIFHEEEHIKKFIDHAPLYFCSEQS